MTSIIEAELKTIVYNINTMWEIFDCLQFWNQEEKEEESLYKVKRERCKSFYVHARRHYPLYKQKLIPKKKKKINT